MIATFTLPCWKTGPNFVSQPFKTIWPKWVFGVKKQIHIIRCLGKLSNLVTNRPKMNRKQASSRSSGLVCRSNCFSLVTYTTLYITHPWGGFRSSIARQPRGCRYRTTRLTKALDEMFTTPAFSAQALFQLWRYRAWKIGPGGCDIHRRDRAWKIASGGCDIYIYTVVYGKAVYYARFF